MNSDLATAAIASSRRGQVAWALYDWANSAFAAVI
ncbi:MAG: MFS transporter, partial [Rhizobiales bacterium]|nr:MFS transporter [Hyphomicrobiales bacterium]